MNQSYDSMINEIIRSYNDLFGPELNNYSVIQQEELLNEVLYPYLKETQEVLEGQTMMSKTNMSLINIIEEDRRDTTRRLRQKQTDYNELDSINRKLELKISKLEDTGDSGGELEHLKKTNLELTSKNNELTTTNDDFRTKLERAECHFEALKADKKKQKGEFKALKKTNDINTVKLIELTAQIITLEGESVELNHTKQQLKTNQILLTEKTNQLAKTETELTEFKDQLSKSRMNVIPRAEFESLQKQNSKLEKESCQLKQNKSKIMADLNKNTDKLARKNDEVSDLKATNKNLEKLIDDLLKPRIEKLGERKIELVDNNNNDVNSLKMDELEKKFVNMNLNMNVMKSHFEDFGAALTSMKQEKMFNKCDLCDHQVSKLEKHECCSHKFCGDCFSTSHCNICYVSVQVNSFQKIKANIKAPKFKKNHKK